MKLNHLNLRTAVLLLCSATSALAATIEIDGDGGASLDINGVSTNAAELMVGVSYNGNSLTVTNDGTVTVDSASVGAAASENNSVLISGSNSYVQAASDLTAKNNSIITIEDGGRLHVGDINTTLPTGGISVGSTNSTATLSVESGTAIEAENLLIGTQDGESGTVTVTGSETLLTLSESLLLGTAGSNNTLTVDGGASLTIGDALQVGSTNGGNNHLYINDGGSVSVSGTTTITDTTTNTINVASGGHLAISEGLDLDDTSNGFNINSGASLQLGGTLQSESLDQQIDVTLAGTNAAWTTAGHMFVGKNTNSNILIVQDGATADTGAGNRLYVGFESDENQLHITGTNSQLTAQNDAFVGNAGSENQLIVENSATANMGSSLTIGGNNADATQNKVIVRKDGQLTVQSDVIVGAKGDRNELNIEDGGTLLAQQNLILGKEDGANGNALNISGSNSLVSISGDLLVGSQGGNNRYFQTGGTNTVGGAFIVGVTTNATGETTIGQTDTTGNLGSVGESAILNIQNNLTVGQEGGGSILLIHDGGTVNVDGDAVIGEAAEDNYIFLQPDDPDTRFNVTGDLVVGKEGGNNRFAVYGGTANIDGSLYLGSSTNQHVDKNYIHLETTNAVLNVANAIHIGASNSVNTLDLVAGATASAQDLFVGAYEGTSNNVVTITGSDSLLSVSNTLTIGSNTGSNNTVNVNGGGTLFVSAGSDITIGSATNDLNNRLNINSDGTLQTLDWDFAAISSNIILNSGAKLEVGGVLTGTNRVDGGVEFALNSGLSTNNAIWDSGSNTLYVGHETSDNTLSVFGEGSVISGNDLIIGFGTNSHNNTIAVFGSNSTLSVANDLTVGLDGNSNSLTITNAGTVSVSSGDLVIGANTDSYGNVVEVYGSNSVLNIGDSLTVGNLGNNNSLSITNGATVNVTSNAWIGLASADNWIEVRGTNSSLTVGKDLFLGSGDASSTGNQLGIFDTANLLVGGDLTLKNSDLFIDYNSQVNVSGNYEQNDLSSLQVWISTNSVTTNLVAGGTARLDNGTTIVVKNDGTIPNELVDEDGTTNKVGRTIVASGDLRIGNQEATTALLHSSINFQTNALLGFDYFVIDDSIYLDNFTTRTVTEAAGLGGMLAAVAREIEGMAAESNVLAQAMIDTFQNGMTGTQIAQAMDNFYGEKGSSIPMNNVINQGISGFASELTGRSDNTRERMGAASAAINWNKPSGAAGPHAPEQELQGWVSGYGSWGEKDSDGGYGSYDSDLSGFIIGADLTVSENLLLGIAGGASSGSLDGDNGKDADSDTTYGALYASAGTTDWFLDGSIIYGSSSVDLEQGDLFNTEASYDSKNLAFYLGGGKEIIGEYLIITPQASLLVNYYDQDDYNEKSTDAVPRSVDGFDEVYIQSSIGCNLGVYMGMGDITLKPEVRAHWLHEFNADDQSLSYGLIGGTGSPYTMKLQAPEEDILLLGAGISAKLSEYVELSVDVDTQQADGYSDYTVLGSLRYQF